MIMSYYKVLCILQPEKKVGRMEMRAFDRKMDRMDPTLGRRIQRKKMLFLLMDYLHVSEQVYQSILEGNLYQKLRGKYRES